MQLVYSSTGIKATARDLTDSFQAGFTRIENIIEPEFSGEVTDQDAIFDVVDEGTIDYEWELNIRTTLESGEGEVSVENLTPSLIQLSADERYLTRLATGLAGVRISSNWVTREYWRHVYRYDAQQTRSFNRFNPASLSGEVVSNIDPFLVGKTLAEHGDIFSSINHSTSSYTFNPDRWCSGINLSCRSIYNSTSGDTRRGLTPITPLHLLGSEHYRVNNGATVRFIDQTTGTIYNRIIVNQLNVGPHNSADGYTTDETVYRMDATIPILPAKLAPSNWRTKLRYWVEGGVPILRMNQFNQATVSELHWFTNLIQLNNSPMTADRRAMYRNVIDQDSSQQAYLVDDPDQPTLLTTWTGGGGGAGPDLPNILDQILDKIDEIGADGHSPTIADWSGYPSYS